MADADSIAGAQRCLFGTSAENHCGASAAVHVLIDESGVPTMSCYEHASWWDTHPCLDAHVITAACGLPGTTWMYGNPGHCVIEGLEQVDALVREVSA